MWRIPSHPWYGSPRNRPGSIAPSGSIRSIRLSNTASLLDMSLDEIAYLSIVAGTDVRGCGSGEDSRVFYLPVREALSPVRRVDSYAVWVGLNPDCTRFWAVRGCGPAVSFSGPGQCLLLLSWCRGCYRCLLVWVAADRFVFGVRAMVPVGDTAAARSQGQPGKPSSISSSAWSRCGLDSVFA